MSAIFGFAYLDGRPASGEAAERMRARSESWGPDGVTVGHAGSAVLGRALLATTPEDRFDAMPIVDEARQTRIVAAARLDNRDELCDDLGISSAERCALSDAALASRAYHRWGEDCPRRLLGDWSLAAWHALDRRLFLARDHIGNTGLFYWHRPPLVAFASNAEVLFEIPAIARRLDEEQLARYLIMRPGDADRTFFEGVRSILPAHHVSIDARGARATRFWRLEDAPPIRLTSDAEYVESFLAHYRRAVRTRLRSTRPVASTLSSGLDSTSVTALAAEALGERGQRLVAMTSVPLYGADADIGPARPDEGPLARAAAVHWDNIDHVLLDSAGASPVAALEQSLDAYSQPMHGASNVYRLLDLFREAQSRRAGVLLTGQLGNGSVSWNGGTNRLFYLLLTDPWKRGLPAVRAWRARHGVGWTAAMRAHLLGPLRASLSLRQRLARPLRPEWVDHAAIDRRFVRRLSARRRLRANRALALGKRLPPRRERRLILELNGRAAGPAMQALGSAFHLDVRDPTTDVRLVEYCFGIPDETYVREGGDRMLVRDAMSGLVPDEVRLNTRRGLQASDLSSRLLASSDDIQRAIDRFVASGVVGQYLDIDRLRQAWTAVPSNTFQSARQARAKLLRGLLAGFFIMRASR